MARIIAYWTLIALILLNFHFCSCRCPLPDDKNVTDIDLNELTGRWFVVAASPTRQTVSPCLRFDISTDSTDSFVMNLTTTNPSNNRSIKWTAIGKKLENEISSFWQMSGSLNIYGPFVQKFLAMDIDRLCAMIICTDHNPSKYRDSFGMVWSRKKTVSDAELLKLKRKVAEYIDGNDIKDVANSCSNM